jgi:hypothetical protein
MKRTELVFDRAVPESIRKELEKIYERYSREHWIRFGSPAVQQALKMWVESGNNPCCTNRYGFYDTRRQEYLDFITGERKACQIVEIMAGLSSPAECVYDSFHRPQPVKRTGNEEKWLDLGKNDYGKAVRELLKTVQTYLIREINRPPL